MYKQNKMLTYIIEVGLKNGFYLLYLYGALLMATNHLFLSTVIILKLLTANFFYWFYDRFHYFGEPYKHWNQLKQFVRFTDSGHLIALLYFFDSRYLPMAFNIHWIITCGYWYGKCVLEIKDCDEIIMERDHDVYEDFLDNAYIHWFNKVCTYMNHGVHICLLLREIVLLDRSICYDYFNWNDLIYTYLWIYGWFFCVYLPWRLITKDVVYDLFDKNVFPLYEQIYYVGVIHGWVFVGNMIGRCFMIFYT